jgi:hypothetical protein
MSFNSRKNLKQNNSNNDDGGGGVIISGEAKKILAGKNYGYAIDSNDNLTVWYDYNIPSENVEFYDLSKMDVNQVPTDNSPTTKIKNLTQSYYIQTGTEYLYTGLYVTLENKIAISDALLGMLTYSWDSGTVINSNWIIYDLSTATNVVDVGANGKFIWYLKSNGDLKIYHLYGGDYTNKNNIIHKTINNVSKCSINMFYGIILKTDGTLHPWPYTEYAENPVQYNSSLPNNLNNIKDISCGVLNPTILKHSGEIVEWGTFSHRTGSRIPKPNINNAIKISAGYSHTLALLDNGTVVGWGFNNDNQIDIPSGLSNIIDISAGFNYSMALRSDGKIICWGNNYNNLCNVPKKFSADIKTAKKITNYNSKNVRILFCGTYNTGYYNYLTSSTSEYGYTVKNTRQGSSDVIQAVKFNFAIPIPRSIYSGPDNYLDKYDFIFGGDSYSKVTYQSGNNTTYQSVFSIINSSFYLYDGSINTTSFTNGYLSPDDSLLGNYFYYRASFYPYSIVKYLDGGVNGEAKFKDAIILKNTSDSNLNNSLIIVGNFTVYGQDVYLNNNWTTSYIETSNFYISDVKGYQSTFRKNFNAGFNFSGHALGYQNTKVQSYGTYDSNNIAYKSSRTIRTIKQYKKDYIIFGDDNNGTHYSLYPNFYVRSLGVNGSTSYAWRYSGNTYLNFWTGIFKTTTTYVDKGVFDIEVQDYDDKVLVAGNFISYDKKQGDAASAVISTPVNNLCRLTSNFDSDTTFNTNLGTGFNDTVNKIHVQYNNKILVGGKFTSFNGVTTNRLVRLNSDGTRDNTFNIGTGFDGEIFDISEDYYNGNIYVAGNFNYYNNENISGVVRLKQNGSLDYYFDVNKNYDLIEGWLDSNLNFYYGGTNTRLVIGPTVTPKLSSVNKIIDYDYNGDDKNSIYLLSNINTTPSISYETYDNSTDVEFLNLNRNTKLLYASSKVTGLTCQNQNLGGSLSIFGYPILTKLIANNLSLTSYYSDVFDNEFNTYEPYILNLSFNSLSSSPFDININSSINNSPIVSNTPNVISYESVDINMMNNSLTSFGGSFGQLEKTKSLNINLQNNKLTKFEINYYYYGGGANNTIINLKNNNLTSNTIEDLLYTLNEYYAVAYYDYGGFLDISGGTNATPSSTALTMINNMRQNGWIINHN